MTAEGLKITSAIFSMLGSILLAYRVTGILKALSVVAAAHEANLSQVMQNSKHRIYWANATQHVKEIRKKYKPTFPVR